MATYYTSAFLRRLTTRKGKPWCGVLKYQEPNPDYVEDTRAENQRRKAMGKRPNPDYVEDVREPKQRKQFISKQITKVFDADTVRTKSQANEALTAWHEEMERQHATPDASLSVAEYTRRHIDRLERLREQDKERVDGIGKSTVLDYRFVAGYLSRGTHPIAGVTLRELTPRQVQEWEDGLTSESLSGTTRAKAHRLLSGVCKQAVILREIAYNPCDGVRPPKRDVDAPNALDRKGCARAMRALANMDSPKATAAKIAMYTALRQGEVCGLTWANVDLDGVEWDNVAEKGPKLRVVQSVGRSGGGCYVKGPKTKAGRRVIPICGGLLDVLRERRAQMWTEWASACETLGMEPTEAAFSQLYVIGGTDGTFYNPMTLSREWGVTAKDLGLIGIAGRRVTFHDLRRTLPTLAQDMSRKSVKVIMGHHDPDLTTGTYTAKDAERVRKVCEYVAHVLDSGRMADVVEFRPTGTDN